MARVVSTRRTDDMPVVRYDIPRPTARGGGFEERWWSPRNAPVLDADGYLVCIIHHVRDVTELTHLQQREAFLLKLTDAMRPLTDPGEIQTAAMKVLAEEFDVMRAAYFEVGPDQDEFTMAARYERGATPLPSYMRLSDFASEIAAAYRAGRTLSSATLTPTHSSDRGRRRIDR